MSQQENSYLGPDQETVYEPRNMRSDPRESREGWAEREPTVYYVTPEQSMLKGEKLVPMPRTKSYSNWIATAVFLFMLLVGGLIWGLQIPQESHSSPSTPSYQPDGYEYHPHGHRHKHHHPWYYQDPSQWNDEDSDN